MAVIEIDGQHAEVLEIAHLLTALLRERSAFDQMPLDKWSVSRKVDGRTAPSLAEPSLLSFYSPRESGNQH